MTKRRASRFSSKSKKPKQTGFDLEVTPAKRRSAAVDIGQDHEERIRELEFRLERVREWLENAEDQSGMDNRHVILPCTDLLMLRGILDDVVNLDAYEDFADDEDDDEDEDDEDDGD